MAKLVINNDKKMSTIAPEIYDISRSIWEDVFMRDFMSERIPISRMSTECAPMWWKH